MIDYIDRETVISKLRMAQSSHQTLGERMSVNEAVAIIEETPAADVAPVRNGEWLLRHIGAGHYWECSVCHTNPCIYVTEHTKFCPNCGARMDGEAL